MPQKVRIALDAMGGDVGASVVIPGAAISLNRHPDSEFLLYRRQHADRRAARQISGAEGGLARGPYRRHRQHARQAEPGAAPRPQELVDVACDRRGEEGRGRRGGLRRQYRRADGDGALPSAHACPASTGRRLPAVWPTVRGDSVVLDLGATIGGDAHHLVSLAVMGSAMASVLFDLKRPTVGLLNIGVEEIKGGEEIREAAELLRAMNLPQLDYIGFVEGDGIGKGAADVIVTEGFSGNIALKAAEGTARQIGGFSAQRHGAQLALQDRLSVRPQRLQGAARQARPEQVQWRRAARPERRRRQEPWRNRRRRLCLRGRCWL